jgi:hypothetical protein
MCGIVQIKTSQAPTLGVGISSPYTDKLRARLEEERYFYVGDNNTTGKSNVDMLALSLQFAP